MEYTIADPVAHREALLELHVEYLTWVCQEVAMHFRIPTEEVLGMPVEEYVLSILHKVCGAPAPEGVFYLLKVDGGLAGMGGIRCVRQGMAELKRIFVRPIYRGNRLGEHLLQRLVSDATAFGYKTMLLDSGPFMISAHKVYERNGFLDCRPYEEAEVPATFHAGWRFMQRTL